MPEGPTSLARNHSYARTVRDEQRLGDFGRSELTAVLYQKFLSKAENPTF